MNRTFVFSVMALLAASAPVFADSLKPVVVTASRVPQTLDNALAPVSVLTREDILRSQARSLDELLRTLPGVSMVSLGGPGQLSTLYLRGSESDHSVFLIDGVRVASVTFGLPALQDIPLAQIERIEVVRGPRSSLYGPEAIGGVVQIFTRKGGGDLKPNVSLGGGSYGSVEATLGLSGGGDKAWFNLAATHEQSDGFNACEPSVRLGCASFSGPVDQPDDDGYERDSANLRFGAELSGGGRWDAHVLQLQAKTEFDGASSFTGDSSETAQRVIGIGLQLPLSAAADMEFKLGDSRDDYDLYFENAFQGYYDSQRQNASTQLNLGNAKGSAQYSIGLDLSRETLRSHLAYERDSRDDTGVFLQYLGRIGAHEIEASLRHDDNQQFGGQSTGNLALGHALRNGYKLTAALATAFRAPSFSELYYPGFSNPELKPEQSTTVELGLSHALGDTGHWSANLYQTEVDDLIAYNPARFATENFEKVRVRGLELSVAQRWGEWDANAAVTLLDAENHGSTYAGNQLPRRAGEAASIGLQRQQGRLGYGIRTSAQGSRFDDVANTARIAGYALTDVTLQYDLPQHWLLQLKLQNVFDKDYETARFYNQPGRSAYVTLRYQP